MFVNDAQRFAAAARYLLDKLHLRFQFGRLFELAFDSLAAPWACRHPCADSTLLRSGSRFGKNWHQLPASGI
jgi:hypothetical protein